jgi:uncharacterized membrane protein
MGKRSRKRTASAAGAGSAASEAGAGTTRAERDAARARRAAAVKKAAESGERRPARRSARGERPPAPWGSFPLVEICVLLAIVLLIWGFVKGGTQGATMVFAGLAVGSLAGLELAIREHFAGFRSHTTLLAGAVAVLVGTLVALAAGKILLPVLLAVGLAVFLAGFVVFRRAFRRASGGLSFR